MIFFSKDINNSSKSKPTRTVILSNRINRNIKLADNLKKDYKNKCQICRLSLPVGKNKFYSEAHHIKPLGEPHSGEDTRNNMIVVCPNCHTQLDKGFSQINLTSMYIIENHNIDEKSVSYHNSMIFEKY